MSETVTTWISEQQRAVEVSGRHAEALRLVGPDDRVWGQWAMSTKDLGDQVERLQAALSEQMPTGKHRAQLIVHDNKGDQWSSFPLVLHGRSTHASSAAQEAKTLQHASSIAIANLETVIEQQRNEITRLSERCDSLLEDQGQLIEVIMSFQTQNTEVDIMLREYEDRKAGRERLSQMASPLLAQLGSLLGPELLQRAAEARRSRANGTTAKGPTNGRAEPPNGAAHDRPVSTSEPKATGAADIPNSSGASANGARKRAPELPAQGPTKNVRAKRSPRTKPLTRSKRK
jgi:hypothetical protein